MLILRLAARVWRLIGVWWRGRAWSWLLQALPALLVGAAILVAMSAALLTPVQELEARYLEQAKTAYKAKDYAGAMTCYDRLAYLGADRPDILYGLALCADGLGQTGRAEVIMNALAPRPDRPGYAPAHLWLARHVLAAPTPAADAREVAESRLLRALDGELDDPDVAHVLLGEVYLAAERYDEAERHLTKAVQTRPQMRIRLAQLYALRGDKERARGEAQLAVNFFRARTNTDLEDHRARLAWADATAFLEDFAGAAVILQEGLNVSDDPVYRAALGGVYFLWADAVGRDPKADPGAELGLVETGLRYDPSNVGLLNRLLAALQLGPQAGQARQALQMGTGVCGAAAFTAGRADQARQTLRGLLAAGKAPAGVHFALGLDAWERGRADEARVHLERANELAPQTPAIANNLAWVLANSEPADLARALDFSNVAVDKSPKDPSFRDTRGRILMKMGQWKDALADLEAALPAKTDDADLHKVLAEVYEHLGSPDMAAEHRRLAEKRPSGKTDPTP